MGGLVQMEMLLSKCRIDDSKTDRIEYICLDFHALNWSSVNEIQRSVRGSGYYIVQRCTILVIPLLAHLSLVRQTKHPAY